MEYTHYRPIHFISVIGNLRLSCDWLPATNDSPGNIAVRQGPCQLSLPDKQSVSATRKSTGPKIFLLISVTQEQVLFIAVSRTCALTRTSLQQEANAASF